jgi:signal transduction histidine kinase/ligand-binding sensor domain-containing protein
MISRKIFFFFVFWLPLYGVYAQQAEMLHFKKIDGLSQSTGYSITKDKQGFLWIATGNGLNRYDGVEMKLYKPSLEPQKGQMQGRVIRSRLLEDEKGQIWFSTDLVLHAFNKQKETFSKHPLIAGKGQNEIEKFANPVIKLGDHLWLANATDGVFDLNTQTNKMIAYPLIEKDENGNPIQLMYHGVYDNNGKLWFASNKGLLCFDITAKRWQRFLRGRSLYSICYSKDTIYVCEGKEMIWFHKTIFQSGACGLIDKDGFSRGLIHCLYTDVKQNTWMGDENGNVYCKWFGNAGFNWVGNINGNVRPKSHYPVYCFFADSSNIVWVGAYTLGLLKAEKDQQSFKSYPQAGSNTNDLYVNSIYENSADEILIGTFENGLMVYNKKTNKASELTLPCERPEQPYSKSVQLIQEDSKGNVWTSKSGFLFVKEKGNKFFLPIKIPPPSNALQVPQMWSMAEYKNTLLIGTTIGLYQVWKTNGKYEIKYLSQFGQDRVFNIWIAPSGEVWIAYESGGIVVYKSVEQPAKTKHLFAATNVRSILFDKEHQLHWIASSSGLIAFHSRSGRYKNFTENDGLLNSYVYGVLQDGDQLWASTSYGLSRASVVFSNNSVLPTLHFTNFTTSDGLPDNVFNARAFYRSVSGCFYFGTTKAVTWFKPLEIKSTQPAPAIRMIDLLVNDKRPDTLLAPEYIDKLSLGYKQNNLFFRFRAIDFENPESISYAYKLEGWDKDWIYSKQLNEVRYSNLPHGSYVFSIKAENGAGRWTDRPYTIAINIQPPFWKTWWFYMLVGMAVLYAAIAITKSVSQRKLRRQLREIEKQRAVEHERNRISKDMHDEIGSGLTHIALLSELLQTQRKSGEEIKKDVGDISASARKLVESMSEIIWALNPQNDTLENLLAYLREQTLASFEPFDINYSIEFPDAVPFVSLSNEQRRNLFLVAKEALNNALKHSGAKEMKLSMEYKDETIHFYITDNGKGFDKSKIKIASNGLRNMQKRMNDVRGTFSLKANETGVSIHFSLKISSKENSTTTFFTSLKGQS